MDNPGKNKPLFRSDKTIPELKEELELVKYLFERMRPEDAGYQPYKARKEELEYILADLYILDPEYDDGRDIH